MAFFKKSPKQTPVSNPETVYTIPYSKGFRGFKRFPIVVHGDPVSEQNNELLFDKDLSSSVFKFICSDYTGGRMAQLFIDDKKVGAVFDPEQVQSVENNLIEQIHVEPREEPVISSTGTVILHRLTILVKYK